MLQKIQRPACFAALVALIAFFAAAPYAHAAGGVRVEWMKGQTVLAAETVSSSGASVQSAAAPSFGNVAGEARISVTTGAVIVFCCAADPTATQTNGVRLQAGDAPFTFRGLTGGTKLAVIEAADAPTGPPATLEGSVSIGDIAIPDGDDETQGAKADAVCATDDGACSIAALVKRGNARSTTLIGHVDGLETLLGTLDGRVDQLEGYVDQLEGYVDQIEAQLTTAIANLAAIETATEAGATAAGQAAVQGTFGAVTAARGVIYDADGDPLNWALPVSVKPEPLASDNADFSTLYSAITASGDTQLVSATASQTTRVHGLYCSVLPGDGNGPVTVGLKSGSTLLRAEDRPQVGGVIDWPLRSHWHAITATNEALNINFSVAGAYKCWLTFKKGA